MPQEKNTMQDDEEEYNEIGTEPIHLGEPQITDQDNSLEAVANKNELSQELLKFLEKEGEERRNFYVTSVENTGGKILKPYWISAQKEAMEKISVLLLKMEFIHLRLNKCD